MKTASVDIPVVVRIGGAPEGVITAAALRCLGGEIQARFRYRNDEERARGKRMGHGDESRIYRTEDLASGAWESRYGYLRDLTEVDLGYCLVIATSDG